MQGRKIRSNHELQHSTALCCAVLYCTIAPPYCRRVHLGLSSRYTYPGTKCVGDDQRCSCSAVTEWGVCSVSLVVS